MSDSWRISTQQEWAMEDYIKHSVMLQYNSSLIKENVVKILEEDSNTTPPCSNKDVYRCHLAMKQKPCCVLITTGAC